MSLVFKGIYLGGGGGGSANLTTLDVTPMTNYQSISPEEGYDGFSLVNVSAVNSSIDPNITASNIVNGVDILGVVGTASASAPKEVARYKINENGVLQASNTDLTGAFNDVVRIENSGLRGSFIYSEVTGNVSFPNCTYIGISGAEESFQETNIYNLDFSNVTYTGINACSRILFNCKGQINEVNFCNLTSVYANSFNGAFYRCNINTANFSSISSLSYNAFENAFQNCSVNNIDFSSVYSVYSYGLANAFVYAGGLENVYMNKLKTVSSNGMCRAFYGCTLKSFSAPNLTNVSNGAFESCFSNSAIETVNLGTPYVEGNECFRFAFSNAANLSSFEFHGNMTNSSYNTFLRAFQNCTNLTSVVIGNDYSAYSPTRGAFEYAFANCLKLETANLYSVGNVISGVPFNYTFLNCYNLANVFLNNLWNINYSSSFNNTFVNCLNLQRMDFPLVKDVRPLTGIFSNTFNGSGIKDIYFNSLTNTITKNAAGFAYMLSGVRNCNVHFPKSMQNNLSDIHASSGFNGINTTILFDLPSVTSNANYYTITQNGTMGGNTFAVNASSESDNAWMAFDNDAYNTGWHSASQEAPHYFTLYFPEGGALRNMYLYTRNGVNITTNAPQMINVCVSNDGNSWNEIYATFSNWQSEGIYTQTTINIPLAAYYKYYKMYFNSYNNNPSYLTTINSVSLSGTWIYNEE